MTNEIHLPPIPPKTMKPLEVMEFVRAALLADRAARPVAPVKPVKTPEKIQPGATYVDDRGYVMNERREFVRSEASKEVEHLFNGFHNLMLNAVEEPYTYGYIAAMMKAFAELVRKKA